MYFPCVEIRIKPFRWCHAACYCCEMSLVSPQTVDAVIVVNETGMRVPFVYSTNKGARIDLKMLYHYRDIKRH